jgi:hypothetical protein
MTKEKQISIKFDIKTAIELLQVLDGSVVGYSEQFAPERVLRLRKLMDVLDKELEKSILN